MSFMRPSNISNLKSEISSASTTQKKREGGGGIEGNGATECCRALGCESLPQEFHSDHEKGNDLHWTSHPQRIFAFDMHRPLPACPITSISRFDDHSRRAFLESPSDALDIYAANYSDSSLWRCQTILRKKSR